MNDHQVKDYLEIIVLLATVSTFVYRMAQMEAKIFDSIDSVKDLLMDRFGYLNSELRIHLTEYEQVKKHHNYALRELKDRTDNLSKKIGSN